MFGYSRSVKNTGNNVVMFSTTRRLTMSADAKVPQYEKIEEIRVDFTFGASDTSNHHSETLLMHKSVHTQGYDNVDQGTTSCNLCPNIHCLIRTSDDSMELLGTWGFPNTIMYWVSYSFQNVSHICLSLIVVILHNAEFRTATGVTAKSVGSKRLLRIYRRSISSGTWRTGSQVSSLLPYPNQRRRNRIKPSSPRL
jgi:hypothetical protein